MVKKHPEKNSPYYYLDEFLDVFANRWGDTPEDYKRWEAGNCFLTYKDATDARDHLHRWLDERWAEDA